MNSVNDLEKKVAKAREIKGETMDRPYLLYTVPGILLATWMKKKGEWKEG